MMFGRLPELYKGAILLISFIVLLITIYTAIRSLVIKRNKRSIIGAMSSMVTALCLFDVLEMHHDGDYFIKLEIPIQLLLLILLALFILALVQRHMLNIWQEEHISNASVKEAFDRLSTGLCYFLENGIPVMVNEAMQDISVSLYGKRITDAGEFWENLKSADLPDFIQGGMTPIVKVEGGKIYSFRHNVVNIDGRIIFEITAADVTAEYELTKELENRRTVAAGLNARLKVLLGTIEYVTMNRELLQLKTALHDNIGQSILIAKRYLLNPQSVDRNEMIHFWKNNIKHLLTDEIEEWELPYYVISKEADRLGIKLQISGELPKEDILLPVVDRAISVHIGNILKHADGKTATIKVKRAGGSYMLTFTNDGKVPEGLIVEKGGLKNLRSDVENVGGSMRIITSPEFCMEIVLPGR